MRNYILYAVVFAILFVIGFRIAVQDSPESIKRSTVLMGTIVEIQIRNENEKAADIAISKAFDEMKRIDLIFSSYDKSGTVYKINNAQDTIFSVDGELKTVMDYSDSLWQLTDGSFDVSLHRLIDLWGFNDKPEFPGDDKIKESLSLTGWNKIQYNNGVFKRDNIQFNFGAVAKGYAVDRAIEILKKSGIEEALVNAGGEIRVIGADWSIGIQDPQNTSEVLLKLNLADNSVATSGDYEQFFFDKDKKYHHILNPSTGYPGNLCSSVTVIFEDNYFADALATGVFVLGPEEGIELVELLENTEALVVDINGQKWMTSGFNNYIIR